MFDPTKKLGKVLKTKWGMWTSYFPKKTLKLLKIYLKQNLKNRRRT